MSLYDIIWNAPLSAVTDTIAVGSCMVYDSTSGVWLLATSANRGTKRSGGIALTAGDSNNRAIVIQQAGTIAPEVSGVGAGSQSWVRVSSTGTLERVTPSGSDDIFGYAEADGTVHLGPGMVTASMTQTVTAPVSLEQGGFGADISAEMGIPKAGSGSIAFVAAPTGAIVGTSDTQALTNKTINGASNTLTARIASDVSGLGTNVAAFLGTPSGANLASALTSALPTSKGGFGADVSGSSGIAKNTTGTFSFVTAPSGALVGDSDTQTLTGKTISGASNTLSVRIASDVTGLGSGVASMLGSFSSANIASACTDETGSGALVFATSPTLSSPTLSGTPTLSGASTSTSNDAKGTATDVNPVHVQTTDATVTTLDSFTAPTNAATTAVWLVTAVKSDKSQAASYSVAACFVDASGVTTQVGSTTTTVVAESDSSWDATIDNSGTTVRLRITGKASTTIQWTAILTKLSVVP